MSDELKHECAVAMVVLRGTTVAAGDYGGTKLSLLMEKQHNRGQDGAGAAILSNNPNPGEPPSRTRPSSARTLRRRRLRTYSPPSGEDLATKNT